eukprot:COSAG06_NODE_21311_length_761_cov_1.480363_1_plen_153_part_00
MKEFCVPHRQVQGSNLSRGAGPGRRIGGEDLQFLSITMDGCIKFLCQQCFSRHSSTLCGSVCPFASSSSLSCSSCFSAASILMATLSCLRSARFLPSRFPAQSGRGSKCLYGKRHFLHHFYIKTIILPRQARDKHKENSKKMAFPIQTLRDR